MGGHARDYERTAALLDRLTTELAAVLCSTVPVDQHRDATAQRGRLRSLLSGRRIRRG